MRKLLAAAILLFGYNCFAQCPFTVALQNKGSVCLGKDTLVVVSAKPLASIKWYKNGVVDTVVNAVSLINGYNPNGVTVAGGNGVGNAGNQVGEPTSAMVDAAGNLYVADPNNLRILKFPPNSTKSTYGITVAGGNGRGGAANQLNYPNFVFVDVAGNMFVADIFNNRIQKFPSTSTSLTNGTTVAGGNSYGTAANQMGPSCIVVDLVGNIYVADYDNDRVLKFPPNSSSITNGIIIAGGNGIGKAANQFNGVYGICLDQSNNLYVADGANNRIQKFPPGSTSSTNGITVAGGNGIGTAANQFDGPSSVWVDVNGYIYVVDWANNRIQRFPPNSTSITNGVTVAGVNGIGRNADQLDEPGSVFVDKTGNIYVADGNNIRVQKFSTTSTIDSTRIPTSPGTYYAVVTDTSGCTVTTNSITISAPVAPTISVSTYGSASVCAATNTVNFVAYITNGGTAPAYQWQVNGVNAGTNDATFSAAVAYNDIVSCILTSNSACASTPTAVSNNDTINFSKQVMLTNKGSICTGDTLVVNKGSKPYSIKWYKDGVLDTTLQVTKNGYATNGITVAGGNGRGRAANQFMGVTSLVVDAMGNIYADDAALGSRILKFPPNSTSANYGATVVDGLSAIPTIVPLSASVDVVGNIYMLGASNRGVLKLAPGSSVANILNLAGNGPGPAANQFAAYAFCVDGSGYMYVADFGNQRILKFPPSATSATNGVIVAGGNGTGAAANQLNQPYSVTVDNSGYIYVADYNNNRVQKFPPNSTSATNGTTISGGNGIGAAANQFSGPIWVSLDANGNLFVADQLNNRIQKFPPNSTSATNGITVAGGNGNGPAANQLAAPSAVVVDSTGNIFISDFQNARIQKFLLNVSTIDTTYIPTLPGTYTAVVTDSAGCSITTNAIIIAANLKPTVTITADKSSVCTGSIMGFTASAINTTGLPTYQWQVNGANVGTNNTRYTNAALAMGDAVKCIIINTGTCGGSDTSNIIIADIKPLPTVGPATDVSISLGQSVVLNMPVTGNIASYLWSPSSTLSNNTILDPTATPSKTTVYTLKVLS